MIDESLIQEVRRGLADPRKLASALGLLGGRFEKQARNGVIVACPVHEDRGRPNLSLTVAPDGTVRAKCHACQWTGDALKLVAHMHGLDPRRDFKAVLMVGAELAGLSDLAEDIEDGRPRPDRIQLPAPRQYAESEYPADARSMWENCTPIGSDPDVKNMLTARGFDASRLEQQNLVRCLPAKGRLPGWASFGRRNWRATGHKAIVRTFDYTGEQRGVRAWRVVENDTPKRLPPSRCKAGELVLCDRGGWCTLTGSSTPQVLWIVEGEPDWIAASLAKPGGHAVIGILSGSWSTQFARVVSRCKRIIVATHPDEAGDRYYSTVRETLPSAIRWRPPSDLDEIGEELQSLMGSVAKWHYVPHCLGD